MDGESCYNDRPNLEKGHKRKNGVRPMEQNVLTGMYETLGNQQKVLDFAAEIEEHLKPAFRRLMNGQNLIS